MPFPYHNCRDTAMPFPLLTRTRQCRFPTINPRRDTALPCPLLTENKKPSPTRKKEGENKIELEIKTLAELTIRSHILATLISQITQSSKPNPHHLFVKRV